MATTRQPNRLLPYDKKSEALPNELVADFTQGKLVLIDENKNEVNVKTGTSESAEKLSSSFGVSITGGATAEKVSTDGTSDVELNVTSLDPTKLTKDADGNVAISISGKAKTAGKADKIVSTPLSTSTDILITGITADDGEAFYNSKFTMNPGTGTISATKFKGNLEGNASKASVAAKANAADKLSAARSIALSGAAEGTATPFDGSENITIPVTKLDPTKLDGSKGAAPVNISGTADTVKYDLDSTDTPFYVTGVQSGVVENDDGSKTYDSHVYSDKIKITPNTGTLEATKFKGELEGNAGTATKLKEAKTFSITGGATADAVSFDGSGNVELNVTSIDPSKLTKDGDGNVAINISGNAKTATDAENATSADKVKSSADTSATKTYITGVKEANGSHTFNTNISMIPSTGTIEATKFKGELEGNAGTATKLKNARNFSITGGVTADAVSFDGSGDVELNVTSIDGSLINGGIGGDTSGNAATATKLKTARNFSISGGATAAEVSFDGSGDVDLNVTSLDASKLTGTASVNTTGNASTATLADKTKSSEDTSATKTYLTGVKEANGAHTFNTNISMIPSTGTIEATKFKGAVEGNADTATKLKEARTFSIAGGATAGEVSFDGSGNVVLNITSLDPKNFTMTEPLPISMGGTGGVDTTKARRFLGVPTTVHNSDTATSFGAGTSTKYGHVKLTDSYNDEATATASTADGSVGASGKALYDAYTALNTGIESLKTNKANVNSPAFTGTPTAPTPASSEASNSKRIANVEYVTSKINSVMTAAQAMVFKGTIGSTESTVTALPANHDAGWTYIVKEAGTYAGSVCEIGDMIVCIKKGSVANNDDWTVIQTNINGAVTGPTSAIGNNVAIFDGVTGKIIKDSGFTIGVSVPSDAKFTDTTYTAGSGLALSGTIINHGNTITAGSTSISISDDKKTLTGATVAYNNTGHITSVTSKNITLPYKATLSGGATGTGTVNDDGVIAVSVSSIDGSKVSGTVSTASALATARAIVLSGDVTGSADFDGSDGISISATLANSGVTAGSYGNASAVNNKTFKVPYLTVDTKGRVTAASNVSVTVPDDVNVKSVANTTTKAYLVGSTSSADSTGTLIKDTNVYLDTTAGKLHATTFEGALSGNATSADKLSSARAIVLSGDVTGSANFDGSDGISIGATLANSGVTAGSYGTANAVNSNSFSVPYLTVDSKGRVTAATNVSVTIPVSDTKVTSTPNATTKAYLVGSTDSADSTGTLIKDTNVYLDTTAGKLHATTFEGALSGNATSADKLSSAKTISLTGAVSGSTTFDGSGNVSISTSMDSLKVVTTYNVTIGTSWSGSDPYTQTIAVSGILATDTPIVDMVCSGTYDTDISLATAWGNIYRITTANESITVYSTVANDVAVPIQLQVIRNP